VRVTFVDMADHLVSRFLRKCSTVWSNYQPSHQTSTIVSTCSIWTSDKHKSSSANYFATIATVIPLLWLHMFGSSTYCSLRCPTSRHMDLYLPSSGTLRSADWYLVTDFSVQRFRPIFKGNTSNKNSEFSTILRQEPEIMHVLQLTFHCIIHQEHLCCQLFLMQMKEVRHCDLNTGVTSWITFSVFSVRRWVTKRDM
jgi:hypothetical protein